MLAMADATSLIVQRLSAVLQDLEGATDENGSIGSYDARRVITRARAAIERYAPPGTPYEQEARAIVDHSPRANEAWRARQLGAVIHALRDDFELGGLLSIREIVHADLFDDFLEMGEELLSKGFIGPAAVIAGTVLEEHLHKLAGKHGISTAKANGRPKSVEDLGVELRKAEVLTEVQRKGMAAWYALRNEAAHGRFQNLDPGEVERMVDGVRDFVARHPA